MNHNRKNSVKKVAVSPFMGESPVCETFQEIAKYSKRGKFFEAVNAWFISQDDMMKAFQAMTASYHDARLFNRELAKRMAKLAESEATLREEADIESQDRIAAVAERDELRKKLNERCPALEAKLNTQGQQIELMSVASKLLVHENDLFRTQVKQQAATIQELNQNLYKRVAEQDRLEGELEQVRKQLAELQKDHSIVLRHDATATAGWNKLRQAQQGQNQARRKKAGSVGK